MVPSMFNAAAGAAALPGPALLKTASPLVPESHEGAGCSPGLKARD